MSLGLSHLLIENKCLSIFKEICFNYAISCIFKENFTVVYLLSLSLILGVSGWRYMALNYSLIAAICTMLFMPGVWVVYAVQSHLLWCNQWHHIGGLVHLSHTWVQYPGFLGHGVKCPILTAVVPGFSGNMIGCTIRRKWGPFGDPHLAIKNLFLCVRYDVLGWNKVFPKEKSYCEVFMVTICPCAGIDKWMGKSITFF